MREYLEGKIRAYFVARHGEGAANQVDFYRCLTCSRLVTWHEIHKGKVCCAGRLAPTNPKWYEVIRLALVRT